MIVLFNKKYNLVKNIINLENLLLEYKKKFKGYRKLIYWFLLDFKFIMFRMNKIYKCYFNFMYCRKNILN